VSRVNPSNNYEGRKLYIESPNNPNSRDQSSSSSECDCCPWILSLLALLAFGGLVAAIIIDSKPAPSPTVVSTAPKVASTAAAPPVIYGSTAVTNYPSLASVPPIDITPFPNPSTEATSATPATAQTMPAIPVLPIIDNKAYTTVKQPSLASSHQSNAQGSSKSLSTAE